MASITGIASSTSGSGSSQQPAQITQSPTTSSAASSRATTSSSTNSTSSSRPPQVHTVKAGAGGFKFDPQQITDVNVGDTVTFEFYPPDHSVVRAEFGSACVPYETTGKDKVGFWSDTQWVKDVNHVRAHYMRPLQTKNDTDATPAPILQHNYQLN